MGWLLRGGCGLPVFFIYYNHFFFLNIDATFSRASL